MNLLILVYLTFLENNGQYENVEKDTLSSDLNESISDCAIPSLTDIPDSSLGLGSLVEVTVDNDKVIHGVIRWIGQKSNRDTMKTSTFGSGNSPLDLIVGVELEEPWTDRRLKLNLSNGVYNGQRFFQCPERRAIFVSPKRCSKDRRFPDDPESVRSSTPSEGKSYGVDCPVIEGSVPALSKF